MSALPRVPLNDLSRWSAANRDEIADIAGRIASSGWFLIGNELREFEAEFAAYCGVQHCIGVANGTDALELGLRALGVGRGDRVLTVANAGMYASTAIVAVGASPLFVDIDHRTMTMCPSSLAACLDGDARAVVITHLYGQLADIDALVPLARARGMAVIEDCAQSHGASRSGQGAGNFGDVGCFSFYPTKNLGALGDAGAIVTNTEAIATKLRALRQYGWTEKYRAEVPGGRNSRLDEFQAAILRLKLPLLRAANQRRRDIALHLRAMLSGWAAQWPASLGEDNVVHLCVIRVAARDRIARHLARLGIDSAVHYPIPDHRQPAIQQVCGIGQSLAVTDRVVSEILTVPCFPELSDAEVERIGMGLREACEQATK